MPQKLLQLRWKTSRSLQNQHENIRFLLSAQKTIISYSIIIIPLSYGNNSKGKYIILWYLLTYIYSSHLPLSVTESSAIVVGTVIDVVDAVGTQVEIMKKSLNSETQHERFLTVFLT